MHDFSSISFPFCKREVLEFEYTSRLNESRSPAEAHDSNAQDEKIFEFSCDAHDNFKETTRGKSTIKFRGRELTDISVRGEVKGLIFWSNETDIQCHNLKRNKN